MLLVEGLGVEGDAHSGTTVQHVYRKRFHPTEPNLRQVHLIHAELFNELEQEGFEVHPGDLGENITTHGIDLLNLPEGTLLRIGRDPCRASGRTAPPARVRLIPIVKVRGLAVSPHRVEADAGKCRGELDGDGV